MEGKEWGTVFECQSLRGSKGATDAAVATLLVPVNPMMSAPSVLPFWSGITARKVQQYLVTWSNCTLTELNGKMKGGAYDHSYDVTL